ncbi:ATP-dependent RNA helicase [Leifsonia xyli subsp. cynodontis DSM 46306]|uniref:ATP-dependent RNA helicase HrpA n=1 Tax=Leifsonia xyli subsp. cynodontis DSM 46306 TaxID=1389489 RepID=U3P3M4_LEIXC|nr:ATP-dependent RNA helicase [Leifsonia xyli subsp. cynodontis DSM 46306]
MPSPAALPRIVFPPELPVSQKREDIARAIRENQVVIVAGETGSGKTTQLPKICLELGRESIGHTQPRRIAARTIAERVAEELGQTVGELVGYQVRFTDRVSAATRIKLMTDGILLNEIHRDRLLRKYDTIIIDEAHERSLNIDFLLGYLRELLPKRPDLKVVITSATIDPESFAAHFAAPDGSPAPIVEVSGRTFPVEVRFRPLVAEALDDEDDPDPVPSADRDYLQGINDALDELARESPGDVLVFLSGENEIRDAADAIRGRNLPGTEVLPLYGRLSATEQHRVFQPSSTPGVRRRVVLATNVAETSLTVPGIKYVVDAGTARISRYSTRAKVQRLPIEAVSQASANQRSGRSGRTSDGIAIRLYSQEDFEKRPKFTEPEILRTNLAAVILQMISLGLGDVAAFPFLTPPDSRGIKDGLDLLTELGAVTAARGGDPALTKVGRSLSLLPIDPRFARMVVESKRHGTSGEVMAIVAGLTIQDPRERPVEKRGSADEKHARFADPTSDFLTLLNLWNYLEEEQKELSSSAFRRLCKAEYLNFLRVREWQDVYRQLRQLAKPLGLTIGEASVNPDGIHRSLLAGLLSHIGLKDLRESGNKGGARTRQSEYLGARQARFVIFPGSTLAKKQPNAIMSAELVETSRLFARMNAGVDPAWAEPIAGELCKRQYSEPHWEKSQGAAVAYEKVTLYGVPIVPRRRIPYSRIDAGLARELFIRHALVDDEWDSHQAFERANRKLRAELREREERTRRRGLLNDEAVFEFYDRRLPAEVVSTRSFEGWWKKARHETPELLTMTQEALLDEDAAAVDDDAFPPVWRQGDQRLTLRYRFEPGAEDDGVTVQVPLPLLAGLLPDGFDWQVPGLRHELVTALIKSLPKTIRRQVVPAADWAKRLLGELGGTAGMRAHEGERPAASLPDTVAAAISRLTGSRVSGSDFDRERLPAHLRPTFVVVGERGRPLASGKSLPELQERLRSRARLGDARRRGADPERHRAVGADELGPGRASPLPRHGPAGTGRGDEHDPRLPLARGRRGERQRPAHVHSRRPGEDPPRRGAPAAAREHPVARGLRAAAPDREREADPGSEPLPEHQGAVRRQPARGDRFRAVPHETGRAAVHARRVRGGPRPRLRRRDGLPVRDSRPRHAHPDRRPRRRESDRRDDRARLPAGAERHARAARRARLSGIRLRDGSGAAAEPPPLPRRDHPAAASPAHQPRPRPRVADPGGDRRRAVRRRRRAHPARTRCAREPRPRPLDARGVPRVTVRPVPRHRRDRVAPAHPQGAHRLSIAGRPVC